MKIRQLNALRAVRATGSTTLAAVKLGLTQSAVSRLVRQLEDYMGFQIFDRNGGRFTITPEGLELLEISNRILGDVDQIESMAQNIRKRGTNNLRIAAMQAIGTVMLPPVIKAFCENYPNVNVSIDLRSRQDVQHLVKSDAYDLGLVTLPVADDGLRVEPICEIEIRCIVSKDHRFADREEIDITELVDENLISISADTLLRFKTEELFSSAGINIRSKCEAQSTVMVANLVEEGVGVAVVHAPIAHKFAHSVSVLKIRPSFKLTYGVIQRKSAADRMTSESFKNILFDQLQG